MRLAIPAFGALAAEPLYVLADTAIVGHLGRHQLGGLGVAGTVLNAVFGIFNFLAYGTTAAVARRVGAGERRAAVEQGLAGLWLAVGLGLALMLAGLALAIPIIDAIGASDAVRSDALTYLRISLLGAPFVLVALAATGYLRGTQDTRTPLVIAVVANVVNLLLELVLVYPLHLGIAGSAWGTVVAQIGAAAWYLTIVGREARAEHASVRPHAPTIRRTAVVGAHLVVRTGSLLLAFLVSGSIAARLGNRTVPVAAHQIAWQLWFFLALSLDAIAIAAQAIVGRALGAGDEVAARAATRRMLLWGWWAGVAFGAAVIAARPWLAAIFTGDHAVRHATTTVLWVVGAMQPVAALVFVLDGILIGAGDSRYLAKAMAGTTAVFLPVAFAVLAFDGNLVALWLALYWFVLARLFGMGRRYRTAHWLVTGAALA